MEAINALIEKSVEGNYTLVNKNANQRFNFPLTPAMLPYMRVTSIATLEACPKSWAASYLLGMSKEEPLTYEGKPPKKLTASMIGTAAHQIIEDYLYYRLVIQNHEAETGDTLAVLAETEHHDPTTHPALPWVAEKERPALIDYIYGNNRLIKPKEKILHIEYEFSILWLEGAPPIKGHIDLLVEKNENTICIVDHKTNRAYEPVDEWRVKAQQMLYAWAIRQLFPQYKYIHWRIGYVNLGTEVNWETSIDDDIEIMTRLKSAWETVKNITSSAQGDLSEFPANLNKACSYCPIKTACAVYKQSTEDFASSMQMILPQNKIERYERLKQVEKLVKAEISETKTDIILMLTQEAQEGVIAFGKRYYAQLQTSRQAPLFSVLWPLLVQLEHENLEFGQDLMDLADEIFSVKLGGLDQLIAAAGTVTGNKIKELIATVEAEEPSIKSVKHK